VRPFYREMGGDAITVRRPRLRDIHTRKGGRELALKSSSGRVITARRVEGGETRVQGAETRVEGISFVSRLSSFVSRPPPLNCPLTTPFPSCPNVYLCNTYLKSTNRLTPPRVATNPTAVTTCPDVQRPRENNASQLCPTASRAARTQDPSPKTQP
jgi:hypothetical protein